MNIDTLYREVQRAYSLPRRGEGKEGSGVQESEGAEAVAFRVDGAVRAESHVFGGFHVTQAQQAPMTANGARKQSIDAYAAPRECC